MKVLVKCSVLQWHLCTRLPESRVGNLMEGKKPKKFFNFFSPPPNRFITKQGEWNTGVEKFLFRNAKAKNWFCLERTKLNSVESLILLVLEIYYYYVKTHTHWPLY